jgi:uncharacterized protein (DUF1499 family)
MILAWLTFFDGILAIALALAGIVASHFGLTPPLTGFQLFLLAFLFSMLGFLIGIIALLVTFLMPTRRMGRSQAVAGTIMSLMILAPVGDIFITHRVYPPINDITTDTKNSPEFVHAQDLPANHGRNMKYDAATYAAKQEAAPAYKDLAPLQLDGKPDDVFEKAEIIAGEIPDWQITYNDPKTRTLEGTATSMVFLFKDDFVIQVRAADSSGSLVEMRSKSRDGKGDLGTNYNRIESFFRLLQGAPRGVPTPTPVTH